MIKKTITLLLLCFINSVLLNANINDILKNKKTYKIENGNSEEKRFQAVRLLNNSYKVVELSAKQIYTTESIDIYLENEYEVNHNELKKIINETMNALKMEEYIFGKLDSKLILLIMDINGGDKGYNAYLQGYSILEGDDTEIENDNKNIIFLDYINGWYSIDSVLNTIIHELQHVIHYSILRKNHNNNLKGKFDVWVDEALSEAAVIAYRGYLPKNRLDYFNTDSMYLITKGDYFINWKGGYTVHKYATVSLFMYWLALQSKNGFEIYKDIANAPEEYRGTYKAILYAAQKNIRNFKDWSELYATWLQANYKNDVSGIYGYYNKIKVEPKIITSQINFSMPPGSAVYVKGDFRSDDKLLRYVPLEGDIYLVYNPDTNTEGIDRFLIVNSYY